MLSSEVYGRLVGYLYKMERYYNKNEFASYYLHCRNTKTKNYPLGIVIGLIL